MPEGLVLLLERIGLRPIEALQGATRTPAEFFGVTDSLGKVEKVKITDLVLLEANPLDEIDNAKKIAAVIIGGKYFDSPALQKLFERAEQAAMKK